MQHNCTKHVDVVRHFIKENLDVEIIVIPFMKNKGQLVDALQRQFCIECSTKFLTS